MIRSLTRRFQSIASITLITLTQTSLLCVPAFAHVDSESPGSIMQERRNLASFIQVQGKLSCEGGVTTGCKFQIKDSKTGQIFSLKRSTALSDLLDQGTVEVAIQGTLLNGKIDVSDAQTL